MRPRWPAVVALLGGCWTWSGDASPGVTACEEGTCTSNPLPHCVRDTCSSDADCASGLSCRTSESETVCQGGKTNTCAWGPAGEATSALVRGFNTRTMDLDRVPGTLRLLWTTPSRALFVTCAIFTCAPVLGKRAQVTESDHRPTDEPYITILNANACVLELETSDNSRSSVTMTGKQTQVLAKSCTATASEDRVFERLTAGCWAYDETSIIAASELIPIEPTDFPTNNAIPRDASCTQEYDICYEPTHRFFGACVGASCSPRCTSRSDCERAEFPLLGTRPREQCGWSCSPNVPGSSVGVCIRLPP